MLLVSYPREQKATKSMHCLFTNLAIKGTITINELQNYRIYWVTDGWKIDS